MPPYHSFLPQQCVGFTLTYHFEVPVSCHGGYSIQSVTHREYYSAMSDIAEYLLMRDIQDGFNRKTQHTVKKTTLFWTLMEMGLANRIAIEADREVYDAFARNSS